MSTTVSNPYSFNIKNNTSFNSDIQTPSNSKTIVFTSDRRYTNSANSLINGIKGKFEVMLMFCVNLDISTENDEAPVYDLNKWTILLNPIYGILNLDFMKTVTFDLKFCSFDPTSGELLLKYIDAYNGGDIDDSTSSILNLNNYAISDITTYASDKPFTIRLTECLIEQSADNILLLMQEYNNNMVDESAFIYYNNQEIENDPTIRSCLKLFDSSIFKTIEDDYFELK